MAIMSHRKSKKQAHINVNPEGSSGFIKLFPLNDNKASDPWGNVNFNVVICTTTVK